MSIGGADSAREALEQLHADALELYERARAEVTIPRRDGTTQKYAAVRYKQQIQRAHQNSELVTVKHPTIGFGHLEGARRARPDARDPRPRRDKAVPPALRPEKPFGSPSSEWRSTWRGIRRDDLTAHGAETKASLRLPDHAFCATPCTSNSAATVSVEDDEVLAHDCPSRPSAATCSFRSPSTMPSR